MCSLVITLLGMLSRGHEQKCLSDIFTEGTLEETVWVGAPGTSPPAPGSKQGSRIFCANSAATHNLTLTQPSHLISPPSSQSLSETESSTSEERGSYFEATKLKGKSLEMQLSKKKGVKIKYLSNIN